MADLLQRLVLGVNSQVFGWQPDAGVQTGDVFGELHQVAQLGAATRKNNSPDELFLVSAHLDLVVHVLNDFLHAGLNDAGQVAGGNFFSRAAFEAGNGNDFVALKFRGEGRPKFNFELLGLVLHDHAAFLDVFCDNVAPQRNDGGMANDAFLKNGDVGRAAPDVNQGYPGFFFFFAQHGIGRGEWLQDEVAHFKPGFVYALVNVAGGSHLTGNDVEIGLEPNARHADRVFNALLVVHDEFLRKHMDDPVTGRERELVHVQDQPVQVLLADFLFKAVAVNDAAVLHALDVLAGNANVHLADINVGLVGCIGNRRFDGHYGFIDIGHHTAQNAKGVGLAQANHFNFAVLVLAGDDCAYFRRADIQPNNIAFTEIHADVLSVVPWWRGERDCSLLLRSGAVNQVLVAQIQNLVSVPAGVV